MFGTGKFGATDIETTSLTFVFFVISVFAQGLLLLYTRSYYAAGETRKPVMANSFSSIVTIAFAFFLAHVYATVLVLPIAFSLGMLLNVYLHWRAFSSDFL